MSYTKYNEKLLLHINPSHSNYYWDTPLILGALFTLNPFCLSWLSVNEFHPDFIIFSLFSLSISHSVAFFKHSIFKNTVSETCSKIESAFNSIQADCFCIFRKSTKYPWLFRLVIGPTFLHKDAVVLFPYTWHEDCGLVTGACPFLRMLK